MELGDLGLGLGDMKAVAEVEEVEEVRLKK